MSCERIFSTEIISQCCIENTQKNANFIALGFNFEYNNKPKLSHLIRFNRKMPYNQQ